mmetsp:Transcript_15705/g.23914  ORF Transcript_15705/g.23914 Transcript_15705/m.23914 type:complete len:106 (-) Transcript_15705:143-460(-)
MASAHGLMRGAALLLLLLGCLAVSGAAADADDKIAEYKQDFMDFDLNKDDQIDVQEVRAQFKGDLDPKELHQFFIDCDKDNSGTVTLKEYIDYAATLPDSPEAAQ